MADKTIKNKHGAQITFSAREGDESDIVLATGFNRVSAEQYAQLKRDKVFVAYTKGTAPLIEVSDFAAAPAAEPEDPKPEGGSKPAKDPKPEGGGK